MRNLLDSTPSKSWLLDGTQYVLFYPMWHFTMSVQSTVTDVLLRVLVIAFNPMKINAALCWKVTSRTKIRNLRPYIITVKSFGYVRNWILALWRWGAMGNLTKLNSGSFFFFFIKWKQSSHKNITNGDQ